MNRRFLTFLVLTIFFCSIPVHSAEVMPVKNGGIMKYEIGDTPSKYWSMWPWGHFVYFQNTGPIIITGIRIYGAKHGVVPENAKIEIWDDNFNTTYGRFIPYGQIPLRYTDNAETGLNVSSWANITFREAKVSGNFSIVFFEDPLRHSNSRGGVYVGYVTPSLSHTSHSVLSDPNKFDDYEAFHGRSTNVDWMIQVLYSEPAPTQTTSTHPESSASKIPTSNPVQTTTKSPVGISTIMIVIVIISAILRNRN
jgi:hypothetical protein